MDTEIRVSRGDDVAELAALWEWLRGERALAGAVRAVQRPPGESELGGGPDLLAVALGSGGAGVAFAKALAAWLRTRRSDVVITVRSPSGSVTIEAHRRVKDGDIASLLQELLRGCDES
jgi:hypothetical protein